jgi:hypothetical protein
MITIGGFYPENKELGIDKHEVPIIFGYAQIELDENSY